MGNDTSVPQADVRAKLEQQRREHELNVQLLKAQEEARRNELEYQHRLALLKAQNEAILKLQEKENKDKAFVHQTVIKTGTRQYSVTSENNPNSGRVSHSVRAENLHSIPGPSRHQRLNEAVVPPVPDFTPNLVQTQSAQQPTNTNRFTCKCNNKLGLMIYLCGRGHNSCRDCKFQGKRCGECDDLITDQRNSGLENLVAQNEIDLLTRKEEKLRNRPRDQSQDSRNRYKELKISCRGDTCSWVGQLSTLKSHYIEKHREKLVTVDSEISIPVNVDMSTPYLLNLGTFTFLFYVKTVNNILYLFVQNIGSKHANNWNYEIHIYDKSQPRRKYTFSNVCHSSTSSAEEIISSQNCSVLPVYGYADKFVNNSVLTLKVFIKRILSSDASLGIF